MCVCCPSRHSSSPLKPSLSRRWGWSRDKMGPRGAPARQYASSTLTPRDRRARRALLQLSLPPRDVTRMMLRGLSNMPNFCRIWPSCAKKICRGRTWITLQKSSAPECNCASETLESALEKYSARIKNKVPTGCCCLYLSALLDRRRRAGVGLDDGVSTEQNSELFWRTWSCLLVQQRRENTWTNDKKEDSSSSVFIKTYWILFTLWPFGSNQ